MRQTAIILEGADCTGKGHVAEMFKDMGFDYYHFGPPTVRGADYAIDCYLTYRLHPGPTVFDRSHLGEQVYGPVYRGGDTLGDAGRALLDAYLKGRDAIVILMKPDPQIARELWKERRDKGGELFTEAWDAQYDAFLFLRTALPMLRYDWTREPLDSLRDRYFDALRFWYGRRTAP